ncbi:hypothetical protein [Anaerosphaera multitolerans]|uniref:Uncharacterized protein n=1 Tax=Anaerosphaera multitolerans TaxID=2487351 RepID=A0A437S6P7_9FIRM|nr:hypothetical protein [Anaerosphaera multitolerans]RVU54628.1 hypothetical protein EF514_06810 [Anaerosphaera multitolerans]
MDKVKLVISALVVIILTVFIFEGYRIYTISEKSLQGESEKIIAKEVSISNGIKLLKKEKLNNSYILIYEHNGRNIIVEYSKSIFLNRYRLENFTANVDLSKKYTSLITNGMYHDVYSISKQGNNINVETKTERNESFILNVLFLSLIIGITYFISKKSVERK